MADQGTEGLLSPWLRSVRMRAAQQHLHGRVLDVGCGSGALAGRCTVDRYVGVDIDREVLKTARSRFPDHMFLLAWPDVQDKFDTIVCLAVIEHVLDPVGFLREMALRLADHPTARIVITTPHPSVDGIHALGARWGLFSRSALEEHQSLLDATSLTSLGAAAGLRRVHSRRFLFGANQLVVFQMMTT